MAQSDDLNCCCFQSSRKRKNSFPDDDPRSGRRSAVIRPQSPAGVAARGHRVCGPPSPPGPHRKVDARADFISSVDFSFESAENGRFEPKREVCGAA